MAILYRMIYYKYICIVYSTVGGILPIQPEVTILPIEAIYRPIHHTTVLYNYTINIILQ